MNGNPYEGPERVNDAPQQKKRTGVRLLELLAVTAIIAVVLALILPGLRSPRPGGRTQCMNNLKNIAIALISYSEEHRGALPPAYTVDKDGKPLHSWRTLILPYLDQEALYEKIDLTKPWDDAANAGARKTGMEVFLCPAAVLPTNKTTYLAVVAPGGCFGPTEPRPISEITDGCGETLMLIEVDPAHAVHWMAPQDADEQLVLSLRTAGKLPHSQRLNVAFVDGSVRIIEADMPVAELQAMISIAGNDN